jgi:cytoskeletal protein CcmA (bactofilin family)
MSGSEDTPRPAESAPAIPSGIARLGPACVSNGDLEAKEDVVIQGVFKGNIRLPNHTLYLDRQAEVEADIAASQVILLGTLTGNVSAAGRVFLAAESKMKGDIAAGRVSIQDGAQFQGHIKIEKGA